MRLTLLILVFGSVSCLSQDKVFFRDGTVRTLSVVSVGKDKFYARESEGTPAFSISKSDVLLIDQASGRRYVFSGEDSETMAAEEAPATERLNMLGVQPFEAFIGRGTIVYERLTKNGRVGFVFPFSVTYNPASNGLQVLDSASASLLQKVGFITGFDLNYYPGKADLWRFYIGPRFRYGTDIMLQNIKGYTLQAQVGWRLGRAESRICQHFAFGFGFLRIQSSSLGTFPEPKQSFGWYSATYRCSFRW